jgi:hypothetical protein
VGTLRRYYEASVRPHARFHFAVLLTVLVVAYVAVPLVARFLDSIGGYNPTGYDPKDFARTDWLRKRGDLGIADLSWEAIVNVGLVLLVAVVWLTLVPSRASRRRSRPR